MPSSTNSIVCMYTNPTPTTINIPARRICLYCTFTLTASKFQLYFTFSSGNSPSNVDIIDAITAGITNNTQRISHFVKLYIPPLNPNLPHNLQRYRIATKSPPVCGFLCINSALFPSVKQPNIFTEKYTHIIATTKSTSFSSNVPVSQSRAREQPSRRRQ